MIVIEDGDIRKTVMTGATERGERKTNHFLCGRWEGKRAAWLVGVRVKLQPWLRKKLTVREEEGGEVGSGGRAGGRRKSERRTKKLQPFTSSFFIAPVTAAGRVGSLRPRKHEE